MMNGLVQVIVIPTLADIGSILTTLITLAVIIFGVVGSIVEARKKEKNRPQRDRSLQEQAETERRRQSPSERLQELAERRRQQLEELARRRREARQQGSGPATAEARPAQREERQSSEARETEDAERRRRPRFDRERAEDQEQLDRQRRLRERVEADPASPRSWDRSRDRLADDRRSTAELRQAEREAKQELQIESLRTQRRQRETAASAAMPMPTGGGLSSAFMSLQTASSARPGVQRRENPHADWLRRLGAAGPAQLQRAVILRDVLGPPVGLRDPRRMPMQD